MQQKLKVIVSARAKRTIKSNNTFCRFLNLSQNAGDAVNDGL